MTQEWKDSSSYSRGERGTKSPSSWTLDLDGLRVVVHRMHGIDDAWFVSCHAMGVDREQLANTDSALAQHEAIDYLYGRALRWADKLWLVKSSP